MGTGGNSFCGDVVLECFNKASRDEDNILEQILKKKCSEFHDEDYKTVSPPPGRIGLKKKLFDVKQI